MTAFFNGSFQLRSTGICVNQHIMFLSQNSRNCEVLNKNLKEMWQLI